MTAPTLRDVCQSCDEPWSMHLDIFGTCAELQRLKQERVKSQCDAMDLRTAIRCGYEKTVMLKLDALIEDLSK